MAPTDMDVLIENVDAQPNSVYGYAKHLKMDGIIDADQGNVTWWVKDYRDLGSLFSSDRGHQCQNCGKWY